MAVEEDLGAGKESENGDADGDLVAEDNVGLQTAEEDEVQGSVEHPDVGAECVAVAQKTPRQPVTGDAHPQGAVPSLREAVAAVVVRRHEVHRVAFLLQRQSSVNDQSLGAADS